MAPPPIRVLSGTRTDLGTFWNVAKDAVESVDGFLAQMMEDGTAAPIPIDEWSRREGTIHDLYVGLVGRRYGQVAPGGTHSVTEQEYEAAGHAEIDRLLFLTEASEPAHVDAENAEAMERFRRRVKRDLTIAEVTSPAGFRTKLVAALRDWERRTLRGATTTPSRFPAFFWRRPTSGLMTATASLPWRLIPISR